MLRKSLTTVSVTIFTLIACGCDVSIFPIWDPNFFDESPAKVGSVAFREFRVDVPDGADGMPAGITVFAPENTAEPVPALLWVTGSNVQAYYHQSLHETLAGWGYAVIVPDGRLLTFTDLQYHRRTVDLARQAIDLANDGQLGVEIDLDRIAVGGYSIGATMASFVAAEDPSVAAVVLWAPTGSPFWTGVEPNGLFNRVTQPTFFLLGEFDIVAPPEGFPREMQAQLTQSEITEVVIPQGLHLFFQQPTGADTPDDPESELTRFEQQGIAIDQTRAYLDTQFGITRPELVEDE